MNANEKPTSPDKICLNCRFFTITGSQNSGLASEWTYETGQCNHPAPALGGAAVSHENLAGWLSCYQFKVRKVEVNS